jgi:hypothetical protein
MDRSNDTAEISTLAATNILPLEKLLVLIMSLLLLSACNTLGIEEIARIDFQSEGDFGQEYSKLFLYRKNGAIEARLETSDSSIGSNNAKLNPDALKEFEEFVNELKKVKIVDNCTTIVNCTVTTKEEIIKRNNIDCKWKGFQNLKKFVFAQPD